MIKGCTYLLLLVALFGNSVLCQLFKLPILVKHYQEHREINPSVNVVDYFAMHYLGEDHNDNDEERDNQLPFKKIESFSSAFDYYNRLSPYVTSSSWKDNDITFNPYRLPSHVCRYRTPLFKPPQA